MKVDLVLVFLLSSVLTDAAEEVCDKSEDGLCEDTDKSQEAHSKYTKCACKL